MTYLTLKVSGAEESLREWMCIIDMSTASVKDSKTLDLWKTGKAILHMDQA